MPLTGGSLVKGPRVTVTSGTRSCRSRQVVRVNSASDTTARATHSVPRDMQSQNHQSAVPSHPLYAAAKESAAAAARTAVRTASLRRRGVIGGLRCRFLGVVYLLLLNGLQGGDLVAVAEVHDLHSGGVASGDPDVRDTDA